jgi:ribonuclease E
VGHISHFGLLEMSRQRIRSSVLESSTEKCAHCGGSGHVRSVSSVALQLLRSLEEMLLKGATHNLSVRTRTDIALYLLNNKRAHVRALEERFRIAITVNADATVGGQLSFVIEKGEQVHSGEQARALLHQQPAAAPAPTESEDTEEDRHEEETVEAEATATWPDEAQSEEAEAQESGRRRRRRRGRRGSDPREGGAALADTEIAPQQTAGDLPSPSPDGPEDEDAEGAQEAGNGAALTQGPAENGEAARRKRRRGRRGGRRNRRGREGEAQPGFEDGGAAAAPAQASLEGAGDAVAEHSVPVPEVEPRNEEGPPIPASEYTVPQPAAGSAEPLGPPATAATDPEPSPHAPRRRSTVREPAQAAVSDTSQPAAVLIPAPAAEPTVSPADGESDRPRRSGWWSRRALGKG